MFDATDLSALDPKYFSIIFTDAFDVTVMSRNTGHYWFIHNPEYPTPGTSIIDSIILCNNSLSILLAATFKLKKEYHGCICSEQKHKQAKTAL
jgi:hypothetical protein